MDANNGRSLAQRAGRVIGLATSCGFMLPVGGAPNAIVYGSGLVPMREMMRARLLVDILSAVVVVAVCSLAVRWVA